MKRYYTVFFILFVTSVTYATRIKDLAILEGGRDNQLIGYGIVVGLSGDGDSGSELTINSVANSLQRFGINVDPEELKSDNVAAVMLTADIPAFSREGTRIDVTVSSMGDAESLQGGVLLQTPLIGADGDVYAVAQGQIAVGGFIGGGAGAGGATVQKNHPTVGIITNGAIVEREIPANVAETGLLNFILLNPDYTTASKVKEAINTVFPSSAIALDSTAIRVAIPEIFDGKEVDFISAIGAINVSPDTPARIVINERTGTIVATAGVRVSTVAVSHGALTITVENNQNVSQPNAFSEGGETEVTPTQNTSVSESVGQFAIVEDFPTINEVIAALNMLGVTTREMMSIFQAMKSAGALQAELIIE
ncbi:flagellar basal body P-ring protein FlgI [Puniceicoccaceae bacterium K14]|nr:flagellar basal body P-ring protein FlgI [Puniceicoccaceae bacterium K14]